MQEKKESCGHTEAEHLECGCIGHAIGMQDDKEREFDEEKFEERYRINFGSAEGITDMKRFFVSTIRTLRTQDREATIEKLTHAYGKDSGPALVIVESLEGSVEQRPGLPEVVSLLHKPL